jgi:hypothetical protein
MVGGFFVSSRVIPVLMIDVAGFIGRRYSDFISLELKLLDLGRCGFFGTERRIWKSERPDCLRNGAGFWNPSLSAAPYWLATIEALGLAGRRIPGDEPVSSSAGYRKRLL